MKFTGSEIRKQTFKTKLHGYGIADVTNFLNEVAVEWDTLTGQLAEIKTKLIEAETKLKDYVSMEKAIEQTFMQAQETTGKAIENSRKEAQLIIQEAELKASQILEKARTDLLTMKEEISILNAKKDAITKRLKMLLKAELETLDTMETNDMSESSREDDVKNEKQDRDNETEDILKSIS